uniref:Linker protein 1 n=1 Tax=Sabella spallanzanii TaxID=85702 RepID=Q9BHA3_SABSP|nr:linker protein 1 [Sabella spallanzanii]CAB38537.1 linker protein 2 [Sabella spallanzanii]
MRSLFLLLVVGIAFGNGALSRTRRSSSWGSSLTTARVDSQEMRLDQLAKQLDSLEGSLEGGDLGIPASMNSLSLRLDKIEGNDCGKRQFSCGRHSGQCVFELNVCDNVPDCANGMDEAEETCSNPVPAGRSWNGVAHWDSCLVRSNNKMNVLITGNKRYDYFPSRLWVDAVIIESYTVSGEEQTNTWSISGFYNYASRMVKFNSPKEGTMGIGLTCSDAGSDVAQCDFVRATDQHVCGSVTLTRGA